MVGVRSLKRWRENYLVSNALAAIARPVHRISQNLSLEIERKITQKQRRNRATERPQLAIRPRRRICLQFGAVLEGSGWL